MYVSIGLMTHPRECCVLVTYSKVQYYWTICSQDDGEAVKLYDMVENNDFKLLK